MTTCALPKAKKMIDELRAYELLKLLPAVVRKMNDVNHPAGQHVMQVRSQKAQDLLNKGKMNHIERMRQQRVDDEDIRAAERAERLKKAKRQKTEFDLLQALNREAEDQAPNGDEAPAGVAIAPSSAAMDDTGLDEALADAQVDEDTDAQLQQADHVLADVQQEEDDAAETSIELEAWRTHEAERDAIADNATTAIAPPLDHTDTAVQAAPLQAQPESVQAHTDTEPPAHQVLRPRRPATRSTPMIL